MGQEDRQAEAGSLSSLSSSFSSHPMYVFLCSVFKSLSHSFSPLNVCLCLSLFWGMCVSVRLSPFYISMHECFLFLCLFYFSVLCGFSIGHQDWEPEDLASGPGITIK